LGVAPFRLHVTELRWLRDVERELLPMLRHSGMGLLVWSPSACGLLSGKYAVGAQATTVALAWLLLQPQVTSVILGAKRPEQLAENITAAEITLQPEELEQIRDASALPPEYPGWMFDLQGKYRRAQVEESQNRGQLRGS
jgi:aryl-alcohol dehydrogenase-like predicted oxidoreductase